MKDQIEDVDHALEISKQINNQRGSMEDHQLLIIVGTGNRTPGKMMTQIEMEATQIGIEETGDLSRDEMEDLKVARDLKSGLMSVISVIKRDTLHENVLKVVIQETKEVTMDHRGVVIILKAENREAVTVTTKGQSKMMLGDFRLRFD